jgi:hypothetical protein
LNIKKITDADIQDFIIEHAGDDEDKLVLKHKEILGVPTAWIAAQIKGRRKAEYKIPLFHKTRGIVYPPSLNLEQSSSEATARFKAQLISKWTTGNKKFCDLTGGFGIDSFFISSQFQYCDFSEPQKELLDLAKQNHRLLGAINIHYHHKDAVEFLADSGKHYNLVYIDPSRRNAAQKKVFRFTDCVPDINGLTDELYRHTDRVMVKASPLLDIQQGIKDLPYVSRVVIVSVDDECKELLFLCDKEFDGEPVIECYNISNDIDTRNITAGIEFKFSEERTVTVPFSDPLKYIYEPNASILKGGAFKSIASIFNLNKIQSNTHLYTSDRLANNFPGRIFRTKEIIKLDKKLSGEKANIIVRNYPLSVDDIKKKTGIVDGGNLYVLCFSGVKSKFSLTADRLV